MCVGRKRRKRRRKKRREGGHGGKNKSGRLIVQKGTIGYWMQVARILCKLQKLDPHFGQLVAFYEGLDYKESAKRPEFKHES